jgi:hypothetical protein
VPKGKSLVGPTTKLSLQPLSDAFAHTHEIKYTLFRVKSATKNVRNREGVHSYKETKMTSLHATHLYLIVEWFTTATILITLIGELVSTLENTLKKFQWVKKSFQK